MSRKSQRVVLKSQAREIVSKVYDFMKKEASNNYAEKITDARWRTAQAVGVSESTVTRILRERNAHKNEQSTISDIESNTATATDDSVANTFITEHTIEPIKEVNIKCENEASPSHSNLVSTIMEVDIKCENKANASHSNLVNTITEVNIKRENEAVKDEEVDNIKRENEASSSHPNLVSTITEVEIKCEKEAFEFGEDVDIKCENEANASH